MLTWSSWPALDGIESTDAGCASDLHSETMEAAVYWINMNPLLSPLSGIRNGGRPLEVLGSSSR